MIMYGIRFQVAFCAKQTLDFIIFSIYIIFFTMSCDRSEDNKPPLSIIPHSKSDITESVNISPLSSPSINASLANQINSNMAMIRTLQIVLREYIGDQCFRAVIIDGCGNVTLSGFYAFPCSILYDEKDIVCRRNMPAVRIIDILSALLTDDVINLPKLLYNSNPVDIRARHKDTHRLWKLCLVLSKDSRLEWYCPYLEDEQSEGGRRLNRVIHIIDDAVNELVVDIKREDELILSYTYLNDIIKGGEYKWIAEMGDIHGMRGGIYLSITSSGDVSGERMLWPDENDNDRSAKRFGSRIGPDDARKIMACMLMGNVCGYITKKSIVDDGCRHDIGFSIKVTIKDIEYRRINRIPASEGIMDEGIKKVRSLIYETARKIIEE